MPILLMICVFLVLCLLYGMYTSARSVVRGAGRIRSHVSPAHPPAAVLPVPEAGTQAYRLHTAHQYCIDELRAVFALYQSGALTKEEFEQTKRHLLSNMTVRT